MFALDLHGIAPAAPTFSLPSRPAPPRRAPRNVPAPGAARARGATGREEGQYGKCLGCLGPEWLDGGDDQLVAGGRHVLVWLIHAIERWSYYCKVAKVLQIAGHVWSDRYLYNCRKREHQKHAKRNHLTGSDLLLSGSWSFITGWFTLMVGDPEKSWRLLTSSSEWSVEPNPNQKKVEPDEDDFDLLWLPMPFSRIHF